MAKHPDGSLTFAIPVRDPRGVRDWSTVKANLAATVRSLAAQKGPTPTIVLGASPGTDLPALPKCAHVIDVDRPYAPLPRFDQEAARLDAIREDKGMRLVTALVSAQPEGHVMVVDYDDLVSPALSSFVDSHPLDDGWFVDRGYVWDGGMLGIRVSHGFNGYCGTSLIVRHDLLRIPETLDAIDLEWVKDSLGSHVRLGPLLAAQSHPLRPLPFAGAVYRTRTGVNVSGSGRTLRMAVQQNPLRHPARAVGGLACLVPGRWIARLFRGAR